MTIGLCESCGRSIDKKDLASVSETISIASRYSKYYGMKEVYEGDMICGRCKINVCIFLRYFLVLR